MKVQRNMLKSSKLIEKKEMVNIVNIKISKRGNSLQKNNNEKFISIKHSKRSSASSKSKSPKSITMSIRNLRKKNQVSVDKNKTLNYKPRRSFNIEISQKFSIQPSQQDTQSEKNHLDVKEKLRKILYQEKSKKEKILNAEKRLDLVKNRIDKSLGKYFKSSKSRSQKKNTSSISTLILRKNMLEKRRRKKTDRRLKVFHLFYLFRKFPIH